MRILVAAAFEAGSQYAHAINTVKMAQGFALLGHEVTILCKESSAGKLDATKLSHDYGAPESIGWALTPSRALGRPIGFNWDYAALALIAALKVRPHFVYARNYILPYLTSLLGWPTVAETHAHPDNETKAFRRMLKGTSNRNFRLLVTISKSLADAYRARGVAPEKILVLPDAADTELFRRPEQLPASPYNGKKSIVAYAGHLYDYKGIPAVLEAAALLPQAQFHFVGGFPEDIARQTERAKSLGLSNVFFHGMRPHHEVPRYLWHADALLLPPSANHPSAQWTSPVKLGEYLASGTPVVATSIPALKDLLSDEEVKFVPPDDAGALADGIRTVLDGRKYSQSLCCAAMSKAQSFSVTVRAQKILENAYADSQKSLR
jgi:glycosyltransferase involved in cell wall biosynthesis